jgi:hypothetical protein
VTETWKPVPQYEGYYEVSDQGRVRSLDRVILDSRGVTRRFRGVELTPVGPNENYLYPTVFLRTGVRTTRRNTRVHVLVAGAFIGPRPVGHDVRHLNGNPGDNRLENLAYGTRSDNMQDASAHGRVWRGGRLSKRDMEVMNAAEDLEFQDESGAA